MNKLKNTIVIGLLLVMVWMIFVSPVPMGYGESSFDSQISPNDGFSLSGASVTWTGSADVVITAGSSTGDVPLGRTFVQARTMFWHQWTTYSNVDDGEDSTFVVYWKDTSTLTYLRGDNDILGELHVTLVEFATDSGITVAEYGPYNIETSAVITSVTTASAFVLPSGCTSGDTSFLTAGGASLYLTDSTHVEINDHRDAVDTWSNLYFQVISGAGLTVERGKNTVSDGNVVRDVTIDEIIIAQTMIVSQTQSINGIALVQWEKFAATAHFSSTTNLRFIYDTGVAGRYEWWQVIEWPNWVNVQYVAETGMDSGDLSEACTISSVDTSASVAWLSGHAAFIPMMGVVTTMADDRVYLHFSNSTITSTTNVQVRRGFGTGYAADYYVAVIEFSVINADPVNDQAPSCTNLDDTDFLYAKYTLYEFGVSVTDSDGYADIDYVQLVSYDYDETTVRWAVTFDQDTSTFTEDAGATVIDLITGSSTYSESGVNLDITFKLYIEWAHLDVSDDDLKQIVYDGSGASDSDLYNVNYNYETRLDFTSGPTIYDGIGTADRGDISDTLITGSVAVKYYGTAFHWPDDSEIDVWASCADVSSGGNPSPWMDGVSGNNLYYLAMASDDIVGLDTYSFKVVAEGAGSGGTDLNHASHTDTYIADRVQVQGYSASDERQAISTSVSIDVTLDYDYDNLDVTDGTVTINGYSASHQGSGVWRINQQTNVPSLITYNAVAVSGNAHGITAEDQNGQSQDVIWDRVDLTLVGNYGWSVIGYNVTLSATGIFEYDSSAWSGVVTWADRYPVESTADTYGYGASRITSITDPTYGVTAFRVSTDGLVIFDSGEVSSVAYYWVQYSVNAVWLIYQTGTWTWVVNGTTLDTGADTVCVIQSEMNETDDDWAIMDSTGDIGDLIIGQFDTSWYYVKIDLMFETTIGGRSFDWEVRSNVLDVDILHSIHITDSGMDIQDNWITFYFHTNWNNATFYVWNADSMIGGSLEGWYQVPKPTTVGLHNFTILVNGTQSSIVADEQTKDFSVSDSWEWINFKYTVNPVVFTITDIYVMQNNGSIIVGGIFSTSDLSIDYTVYEDGIYVADGTVNIPASGDYYVIRWDKSSETSVANWTLVMASGTNITIYGYNMQMETAEYNYNSSGQWIEENYIVGESVEVAVARATESMWDTVGLILILLIIPFVVGIAVKIDRKKSRSGKRDKANDKFRSN